MSQSTKLPSIALPSFNCPHCGALAHQTWFYLYACQFEKGNFPHIFSESELKDILRDNNIDKNSKNYFIELAKKFSAKLVFMEKTESGEYLSTAVRNMFVSKCFSCSEYAIWVHENLIFPSFNIEIAPSNDLPNDIKTDFEEAAKILNISPRGSAALARLCIQKLCKELGEKGQNINDDIGELVKKGLDKRIQKALDIVRVVGNNAVHPGKLELNDDKNIAIKVLHLVNMIAEEMISKPKHIDQLFNSLPVDARKGIERRDSS